MQRYIYHINKSFCQVICGILLHQMHWEFDLLGFQREFTKWSTQANRLRARATKRLHSFCVSYPQSKREREKQRKMRWGAGSDKAAADSFEYI